MFLFRYMKTLVCAGMLAVCSNALAVDYSSFTNQELLDLRGAVANASAEEQEAYQREWQNRMQNMNEDEKAQFTAALESGDGSKGMQGEGGKIPFVIQGKGYDTGSGTVIFGGLPSGKSTGKGGGR